LLLKPLNLDNSEATRLLQRLLTLIAVQSLVVSKDSVKAGQVANDKIAGVD
jgi:hypothetical protein